MTKTILISICSRTDTRPESLMKLLDWCAEFPENSRYKLKVEVGLDRSSYYLGHSINIYGKDLKDDDIIVMCHDDIEILQDHKTFETLIENVNKKNVGFIGVAGSTMLNHHGTWWQDRTIGATRGFVFQGKTLETMTPNYFGPYGQVVVLDGCFLATSFGYLKKFQLDQSKYISSGWDFYDISLTFEAYLRGYDNYVVPILVKHESPGIMRKEWNEARQSFLKWNNQHIPTKINLEKTLGLPK